MDQALSGVRIIDMTHNQAGPACTQILGFLGADVMRLMRCSARIPSHPHLVLQACRGRLI